jgi:protein phosphatase-4 regulatory subunit 3
MIDVMHQAEDLENLENLHSLCSLMQTIRESQFPPLVEG